MPGATAPHPDQLAQVEQLLEHFEQLEAQFQRVREGLTHSHRLTTLGTIASIMAHEYNNILTPVISYAQLALADPDNHQLLLKAVKKGLEGAERAAAISSSLLGFARESDDEPCADLRSAIDETINCLARDPRKDGIDLTIEVPHVQVAICPLNLQQVLMNLLLNARQAMGPRGGRLRIKARTDGGLVQIDVSDSGPGIPPQIMDRLFEPFVTRRDKPENDSESGRGTGLGLCICRDLVQHAGGTIEADSQPGRGATFHITLPVSEEVFQTT